MEVPAALGGVGAALDPGEAAAAWLPRSAPPPGLSLETSEGSGWEEGVAAAAGRHYRACLTCRTSKIRCSSDFPCTRCFRLSLPCQPQFWRKDPHAGLRGTELVFKTVDPRGFAALYIEGFTKVFREGRVDRARAVWMMRIWAGMSAVMQHDITFGLLAAMARALRISPLELEGPDSVRTDMHPDARRAFLAQRARKLQAANAVLQQTELFKSHDGGEEAAIFMAALMPGRAAHASNAAFGRLFRHSCEIMGDVLERKCLPALLFAGVISPDDRALWLHCMAELLFAKEEEGGSEWTRKSHFLKVFDRDGDIRIFIYTVKLMQHRPGETFVVHRLEPAPPSRHLTDRPDNHKVMKTFRQVRPLERAVHAPHPHDPAAAAAAMSTATAPTTSSAASSSSSDGEQDSQHPPQPPPQAAHPHAHAHWGDAHASDGGGSAASSVASGGGSDERRLQHQPQQPPPPRPSFIPGMVFLPMNLGQGGGGGSHGPPAPAAIKAAAEQGEGGPPPPLAASPASSTLPTQPPPLLKQAWSGSSDSGSGGCCTDREERDSLTGEWGGVVDPERIEAIFELEATRRKRKLGHALVVDPTTSHLEMTLRGMVVTTGGVGEGAGAGGVAPAPSAAGAPAPAAMGAYPSYGASSAAAARGGSGGGKGRGGKWGGGGSPLAGASAASSSVLVKGVVGGSKKGRVGGRQSSSPSPVREGEGEGEGLVKVEAGGAAGLPAVAASVDVVGGFGGQQGPVAAAAKEEEEVTGPAATAAAAAVSALGVREDEAMLLLSLRMGGR